MRGTDYQFIPTDPEDIRRVESLRGFSPPEAAGRAFRGEPVPPGGPPSALRGDGGFESW